MQGIYLSDLTNYPESILTSQKRFKGKLINYEGMRQSWIDRKKAEQEKKGPDYTELARGLIKLAESMSRQIEVVFLPETIREMSVRAKQGINRSGGHKQQSNITQESQIQKYMRICRERGIPIDQ